MVSFFFFSFWRYLNLDILKQNCYARTSYVSTINNGNFKVIIRFLFNSKRRNFLVVKAGNILTCCLIWKVGSKTGSQLVFHAALTFLVNRRYKTYNVTTYSANLHYKKNIIYIISSFQCLTIHFQALSIIQFYVLTISFLGVYNLLCSYLSINLLLIIIYLLGFQKQGKTRHSKK